MGKKLIRYRKPSVSTMLGVTKAKRRVKKSLGVYEVTKYTNAPKNLERRIKRRAGYYSEPMKAARAKSLYVGPFKVASRTTSKAKTTGRGKAASQTKSDAQEMPDAIEARVNFGLRNKPHERNIAKTIEHFEDHGYKLENMEHKTHGFLSRMLTLWLLRNHTRLIFTKATE